MGKWQTRQQPWAMLPEGLSAVLLPHLETVADDLLEAAQHDVPDYAAVLRGASREPIRQRVLVDVAGIDTSASLLGEHCRLPLVLAPVGLAGMMARRVSWPIISRAVPAPTR